MELPPDDPARPEINFATETKNTPIPDGPFVFVSYSSKDSSFVHAEIKRLKKHGCEIWYDREQMLPGRDWGEEIRKAIQACACFIVFITEDSVISLNVLDEIKQALEASKPFIGIYWDDVELPHGLHEPVRRRQTLDRHSMRRLEAEYEEPLRWALSEYCRKAVSPPAENGEEPRPERDVPRHVAPSDVLPNIFFFSLTLSGGAFFLVAVAAFLTPYFPSVRPDDPLNNRFIVSLISLFFTGIAFSLEAGAFAVYRIYLRRKND